MRNGIRPWLVLVSTLFVIADAAIGTALGATTPRAAPAESVHCQIEADGQCHCGPRRGGTGRNIPCRPDMTQQQNSQQQNSQPQSPVPQNAQQQTPQPVATPCVYQGNSSEIERMLAARPGVCERYGTDQIICQNTASGAACGPPPDSSAEFDCKGTEPLKDAAASAAAQDLKGRWQGAAARVGDGVKYASTAYGGATLHAFEVRGPITMGYSATGLTLQKFVSQTGSTGGVTGTFSGWPSTRVPAGPVVNGSKWTAPSPGAIARYPRSFLGYGNGRFFVGEPAADDVKDSNAWKSFVDRLGATEGLGGLGRLLASGRDCHKTYAMRTQKLDAAQAGDGANARAVAGVSQDGSALILLVQEGNTKANKGAGLSQMARVLTDLGAYDAVIMDGGGSAQYAVRRGGAVTTNRPNDARDLPTAILF